MLRLLGSLALLTLTASSGWAGPNLSQALKLAQKKGGAYPMVRDGRMIRIFKSGADGAARFWGSTRLSKDANARSETWTLATDRRLAGLAPLGSKGGLLHLGKLKGDLQPITVQPRSANGRFARGIKGTLDWSKPGFASAP